MTYNNQYSNTGFNPNNGFSSRGKTGGANPKRLSVALPKVGSISEDHAGVSTPRTTSRSHLLAGLRTAPKQASQPASAPYSQSHHNLPQNQWANAEYDSYNQGVPQTAMGFGGMNQYSMQAGQQTYALPEQILAPPMFDDEEMDPQVFEQLQLTSLYLAQRQQQLQQQLANVTAAASQFQGLDMGAYQQHLSLANLTQQAQDPIPVPGQPGMYIVQNPLTGQYQYVQAQQPAQRSTGGLGRSQTMHNLSTPNDSSRPVFRAEISPPPADKPVPASTRSISPPTGKSKSPQPALEHVEPLPPPSANAFRRGHQKKVSSLSFSNGGNQVSEGPKTSSAATFGSSRVFIPPTPMTGTFGPGAARAGEHPIRQPRGPPPMDELVALPTANHEGSKNFAARRRRRALNLVRAGSVRRGASNPLSTVSPTSDSGMSLNTSEEDEPGLYRKQSPIGSERSGKRGSQSSIDGSLNGSAVQTPATEDSNMFDMSNFIKHLPPHIQQGQERRKMMVGVLSAAEKRKSNMF